MAPAVVSLTPAATGPENPLVWPIRICACAAWLVATSSTARAIECFVFMLLWRKGGKPHIQPQPYKLTQQGFYLHAGFIPR